MSYKFKNIWETCNPYKTLFWLQFSIFENELDNESCQPIAGNDIFILYILD